MGGNRWNGNTRNIEKMFGAACRGTSDDAEGRPGAPARGGWSSNDRPAGWV